jgi:hypothetical protein
LKETTIYIDKKPLKIRFSKWFEPYQGTRTTLSSQTKANRGIYFIKSKRSKKIIYVGSSETQLYKTIYRHFQIWNDNRPRITYGKNGYLIKVILTTSNKYDLIEQFYINKLKPRDCMNKYEKLKMDFKSMPQVEKQMQRIEESPF